MELEYTTLSGLYAAAVQAGIGFRLSEEEHGGIVICSPGLAGEIQGDERLIRVMNDIRANQADFVPYATARLKLETGKPLTEADYFALPILERLALPRQTKQGIFCRARAEWVEELTIEGWEYAGEQPNHKGLTNEPNLIYKREIGGRVEWAQIWYIPPNHEQSPERSWVRQFQETDPRLLWAA